MSATRLVVALVGATLILAVGLIGLLAGLGQTIPDVLQNVAIGSLTALVGLLVPRPEPSSSSELEGD